MAPTTLFDSLSRQSTPPGPMKRGRGTPGDPEEAPESSRQRTLPGQDGKDVFAVCEHSEESRPIFGDPELVVLEIEAEAGVGEGCRELAELQFFDLPPAERDEARVLAALSRWSESRFAGGAAELPKWKTFKVDLGPC